MGEEEFSNAHIYSLKQHPNGLLYVATNYGLYVYRNGSFQPVPLSGNKNISSLFSLRLDSKNNLFCANMYGEIFKLTNDSLKSYAKMPEQYLHKYGTDFGFNDEDNIIVKSSTILIYKNSIWKEIEGVRGSSHRVNWNNPKSIIFPNGENTLIHQLVKEKIELLDVSHNSDLVSSPYTFPAYVDNNLLGFTKDGYLLNYKLNKQYEISNEIEVPQQTEDGTVWLLSDRKGISLLVSDSDKYSLSNKYFNDIFISTITVSKDGVAFLGTFGKGIIVIPNINFFEYKTTLGRVEGISSIPNSKVTTSLKKVIKRNKALDIINLESENSSILLGRGKIFYEANFDFNLEKVNKGLLSQEHHGGKNIGDIASIKYYETVNDSTKLVGTSVGLLKVGTGLNHINWRVNGSGNRWFKYSTKKFRSTSVGYVASTQNVLYTNYGFLHNIDSNGKDSALVFNNEEVKCSDIFTTDSMAFCATSKYGILFFKDGKFIDQLAKKEGLLDDYVKKIIVYNDKIYIASRSTFQVYNLKEKKWETLGRYHNLIRGAVSNMMVANNKIWLASSGKVLALPLNSSEKEESFTFRINKFILGDSIIQLNEELTTTYNKNNFTAELDFRGVLCESQVKIEYRLNNSNWKSIKATSDKIEYRALEPNNYSLEIRLNLNGKYSHHQNINFEITSPFWENWWFYLSSVLVIVLMVSIIAIWQIKKIRHKNKELIEKQKLKANLLDSELKTLRSQMNPHFIFNSLNSIQDLILKEDTDGSYDYVVLFANLVRSTLNYSNKDFIPIEKELEFLEVYLKLEKLRFGDEFTYEISCIGTEGIEVPSLIVQPFLENALIHGLLHKKGVKTLSISFELSKQLKCVITDNGVGRKRSQEIKERQGVNHESFALEAIRKRLSILSDKDGNTFGYEVTDLYQDGIPSGTQIEVTIPHKFLY
jgi:ligand-binding sensor domain-containing protein